MASTARTELKTKVTEIVVSRLIFVAIAIASAALTTMFRRLQSGVNSMAAILPTSVPYKIGTANSAPVEKTGRWSSPRREWRTWGWPLDLIVEEEGPGHFRLERGWNVTAAALNLTWDGLN
ncbi:hypothetical protein EDB80DRAFT_690510 [Ilyonectria destructans]|nr:hypothetical protein EDB80DRAFT_690510 [Ilyonectria destructans]